MQRLVLVRHAPTSATRGVVFPGDEPIVAGRSEDLLERLGKRLPRVDAIASPSLRCRQTAEGAGFTDVRVEPAIAECDFGRWTGLTLRELHDDSPESVNAWMTDPDAAPHGGESLRAFVARIGAWLDELADRNDRAVAFTHGGVVKAAVVHALGAPIEAFWRIDADPYGRTEMHAHDGRWTVSYVNASIGRNL